MSDADVQWIRSCFGGSGRLSRHGEPFCGGHLVLACEDLEYQGHVRLVASLLQRRHLQFFQLVLILPGP